MGLTHVVGTLLRLLVGGHLYALKYKTSNVLFKKRSSEMRSGRRG